WPSVAGEAAPVAQPARGGPAPLGRGALRRRLKRGRGPLALAAGGRRDLLQRRRDLLRLLGAQAAQVALDLGRVNLRHLVQDPLAGRRELGPEATPVLGA